MATMISGINTPTTLLMTAVYRVTCPRKSEDRGPSRSDSTDGCPANPAFTPTRIGVPTAPKATGVDWTIRAESTAAMAGKPIATSRGAAIAAGVPNPAAPSSNPPNSQATMIAWTRRSGEIVVNPARIDSIAPDSRKV